MEFPRTIGSWYSARKAMARARRLSHLDRRGRAGMVDGSPKPVTAREAIARGEVRMRPETLARIAAAALPKGDVLAVARLAGIMGAKRTADLVPLCHPLPLSHVAVELTPDPAGARVLIESRVRVAARTGVEMEALTAVAVAGLTLYDMCKAVDREMTIGAIRLVRKTGGRSGTFIRRGEPLRGPGALPRESRARTTAADSEVTTQATGPQGLPTSRGRAPGPRSR